MCTINSIFILLVVFLIFTCAVKQGFTSYRGIYEPNQPRGAVYHVEQYNPMYHAVKKEKLEEKK
jgi:hypothetical protein